MLEHYVPDVGSSPTITYSFGNTSDQRVTYEPQFVSAERQKPEAHMTAGEAFQNVWLYGNTTSAILNGITKPNIDDPEWVRNNKAASWVEISKRLGPRGNAQVFTSMWDNNVNSAYDAGWFQRTALNKIASDVASQDHILSAIGAWLLDPVELAVGGGLAKVGKVKQLVNAMNGLQGAKRFGAFATVGAGASAVSDIPKVLWNYEDSTQVITGAVTSAALFAFGDKLISAAGKRLANRRRIDDNADPAKAVQKAIKKPETQQKPAVGVPTGDNTVLPKPVDEYDYADMAPTEYDDPYTMISTNTKADQVINSPSIDEKGKPLDPPKTVQHAKLQWHQRFINRFLGFDYEVQKLWGDLAQRCFTLSHRGARGIFGATSVAKQNYDYITANNVAKFQKLLQQRVPGYFPQGAMGNLKHAMGKNTQVIPPEVMGQYQREAIGYLASMYNWQATEKLRAQLTQQIIKNLNPALHNPDAVRAQIKANPKVIKDYLDEANKQIQSRNSQMLISSGGLVPKKQLQQPLQLPGDLLRQIPKPDINRLSPTARTVTECYQESGISRQLGRILTEKNMPFVQSDNYYHLAIDPVRFDELAQGLVPRMEEYYNAQLKKLNAQEVNLQKRYNYLIQHGDEEDPRVQIQLERLQNQLQDVASQIVDFSNKTQQDKLADAYQALFHDYGEQIYQALTASKGSPFKKLKAEQIGALLIISRIQDTGGHDALFKAIQRQRKIMGDNLNDSVLKELAQATNEDFNAIPQEILDKLDLANLTYFATAQRRTNNVAVIGSSKMLKKRFRQDYMRPGGRTGIAPYEFLQSNMYKGAQDMVRQECHRASLVGIKLRDPFALPGDERQQNIIDLGNPEGLTRAGRILTDLAVKAGYDKAEAQNMGQMFLNSVLGRPMGDSEEGWMQVLRSIAGTMFLKNSGIFNLADVAQLCLDFSYSEVARSMIPAMKMGITFSKLSADDKQSIRSMLAKTLAAEGRLVPSMERVGDDLQDASKNRAVSAVHYFAQYGRFANASEFIRNWENNIGSIIYETRLLQALKKGQAMQGVPQNVMAAARSQYKKYGQNFQKWNADTKRKVIGAGNEMMSNIILSLRAGERPRFLSTNVGRFIFAYQSFIFAAHKKLLMRYKNNYGMLRLTHLLAVQMAAGVGIVAMANALDGKDPSKMTPEQFGVQLGTSVSALGLFGAMLTALARGQIGGTFPGLSAASKMAAVPYNVATGDFMQAYKGIPLLPVFLPLRAAIAALTGDFE